MANNADPDQLASSEAIDLDLHCLQRQGISGISRTRAKVSQGYNGTFKSMASNDTVRGQQNL